MTRQKDPCWGLTLEGWNEYTLFVVDRRVDSSAFLRKNTRMVYFPGSFHIPPISVGKESTCIAGDPSSIPGQEGPLEKG